MTRFSHAQPGTPAASWHEAEQRREVPEVDLTRFRRVVVLGAHPDDETLGAGGLIAQAHRLGLEVVVAVATRGERSHPGSPTHTAEQLADLRSAELISAVTTLSPGGAPSLLHLPDGEVSAHEQELTAHLVTLIGDGRDTLVVATWRGDGHPDHEAVGRAGATAAARTGAHLLEYPVWFWHWAQPTDAPWRAARRLSLADDDQDKKAAAIAAHRTQVAPLSPAPGDEALLSRDFLEHFTTDHEVYWQIAPADHALDELHREHADPWGVDRRWYERRKRDLLLAALPRERFARGVEIGCSTGALTEDLAARCDSLIAVDSSTTAVAAATRRLAHHPHVKVEHASVPDEFDPAEQLDLVVLSEVAYFLSRAALEVLAARVTASLTDNGVVVLCHWKHEIEGWPLDGPTAHDLLRSADLPPVIAQYRDRDVEILVMGHSGVLPDPRSG